MTDDYNTFTDRSARNCAVRRAEQEEQRREEEQRRAQPPQQQQSTSYQLPVTDAMLVRMIDDRIAKAMREAIGPQVRKALDDIIDQANDALNGWYLKMVRELIDEKLGELRVEREHDAKKIAGLNDEIAGLRADLTIMRTINANRNLFGVVRKEAKG